METAVKQCHIGSVWFLKNEQLLKNLSLAEMTKTVRSGEGAT
jgi:hypothetical protein